MSDSVLRLDVDWARNFMGEEATRERLDKIVDIPWTMQEHGIQLIPRTPTEDLPVFLSEYGVGSQPDPLRLLAN